METEEPINNYKTSWLVPGGSIEGPCEIREERVRQGLGGIGDSQGRLHVEC